jgi:hypothetical protein
VSKLGYPSGVISPLQHRIAQTSGYRRADRAVIRAGELVVPRQEEVDLLLGHHYGHRAQAQPLTVPFMRPAIHPNLVVADPFEDEGDLLGGRNDEV